MMSQPKGKPHGQRSDRYSRSRSRSRSPYLKKEKYFKQRSRSPRRRSPPPKKLFQRDEHHSYSPSPRKKAPSGGKMYSSKNRSRTPSPYRHESPPRQKLPTRPKTSHHPLQRRTSKSDHGSSLAQGTRPLKSSTYTGSSHERFDPSQQRSWSPDQSSFPPQYGQTDLGDRQRSMGGGRRSPPPGYDMAPSPPGMLFPAATKPATIVGPITIPQSHSGMKIMLSNRFGFYDDDVPPLIVEDNITIGIQRRGPNMIHDPHRTIIRSFRPGDVLEIHRRDEGKFPIFDREEIKIFRHDDILDDEVYEERRTISVAQTSKLRSRNDSYGLDRRIIHQGKDSRHSSQFIEPQIKFDPRPDPRYESLLADTMATSFRDTVKVSRVQRNPNDLRHSILKRRHDDDDDVQFDARKKIDAKRKDSHKEDRVHSKDKHRERSGDKRRSDDRSRSSDSRHVDSKRKQTTLPETEILPDFSNRPGRNLADRAQLEDWKDKPEMIPKNPMYYEHDVREDSDGYRGRGSFRGNYQPRGVRTRGYHNRGGASNYRESNYKGTNFIPNFRPRGFRRPFNNNNFRARGSGYSSSDSSTKTFPSQSPGSYKPTGSNYKQASDYYKKTSSGDRVWKHDLYEDSDKEKAARKEKVEEPREDNREDNKPTSTT